jgi:probable rRNA maturation factor
MRLDVSDRRQDRSWRPPAKLPATWKRVCKGMGLAAWRLDLILVDDQEMQRLNSQYRGVSEVTDVLSFSYLVAGGEGPPALSRGERFAGCDLWLDRIGEPSVFCIGEILLAPAYVVRECRSHDRPLIAELMLLMAHGALHVLGWEHDSARNAAAMRAAEAELLQKVGLAHPLMERGLSSDGKRDRK